jgi:hypothetical protein
VEVYEDMLNFFVEYLNYEKLGQIDNSHLVHADRSPFYAKAKECVELAIAHGKAVDFPKSGFCPEVDPKLLVSTYPDFMEKEEAVIPISFSPSTSASPSSATSTATSKSASRTCSPAARPRRPAKSTRKSSENSQLGNQSASRRRRSVRPLRSFRTTRGN